MHLVVTPALDARARRRANAVDVETVAVRLGEVLPGRELPPVERFLQDPVAGSRRVGGLDDDVSHLVSLQQVPV